MPTLNLARPLRIATRESPLAMWQARHVAARLAENGVKTEIVPLVSSGDVDMTPIDGTRQVGVFTKRIQQALVDGVAEVAVHSLKDLPTDPDPRFTLAAVPPREIVADSLISHSRYDLRSLPEGATVGTGSRRRAAQLLSVRPDLRVVPIRGNVQTRLSKLDQVPGDDRPPLDAIVLAEAGLLRLGRDDVPRKVLNLDDMLPAPGQGALGIEVRSNDAVSYDALCTIDDAASMACVIAERTVLARLHGGCLAPIAAHACYPPGSDADDSVMTMRVCVLSPDGSKRLDRQGELSSRERSKVVAFAEEIGDQLIADGALELIRAGRESA